LAASIIFAGEKLGVLITVEHTIMLTGKKNEKKTQKIRE
jgi:hypothetical protein